MNHLEKVLRADEKTFEHSGIKLRILGHPRADYDIMLMPPKNDQETDQVDTSDSKTVVTEV